MAGIEGKRESNIDLLRFICMLMVVSLHYFGWGGVTNAEETSKINYLISCGLSVFCRVAVNCFYMISGFFIHEKDEDITARSVGSSVLKQYKKIWRYSVLIFIVAVAVHAEIIGSNGVLQALFPVMSNTWWFATVFLLLTCIRPFVGKMLVGLKDKELALLLGCIAFFDTVQAVIGSNAFGERGAGILHASFMLIIGYAIKRWNGLGLSTLKGMLLYLVGCLLAGVFSIVEKRVWGAEDAHAVFYNSPLILIASVGFFVLFLRMNCSWKWPKLIAPHVFAIYLLNDHPFVREVTWKTILHCDDYYESRMMIVHWLFSIALFAVVGLTIDWLFDKLECYIRFPRKG